MSIEKEVFPYMANDGQLYCMELSGKLDHLIFSLPLVLSCKLKNFDDMVFKAILHSDSN